MGDEKQNGALEMAKSAVEFTVWEILNLYQAAENFGAPSDQFARGMWERLFAERSDSQRARINLYVGQLGQLLGRYRRAFEDREATKLVPVGSENDRGIVFGPTQAERDKAREAKQERITYTVPAGEEWNEPLEVTCLAGQVLGIWFMPPIKLQADDREAVVQLLYVALHPLSPFAVPISIQRRFWKIAEKVRRVDSLKKLLKISEKKEEDKWRSEDDSGPAKIEGIAEGV